MNKKGVFYTNSDESKLVGFEKKQKSIKKEAPHLVQLIELTQWMNGMFEVGVMAFVFLFDSHLAFEKLHRGWV